jgi:hypothetical protein
MEESGPELKKSKDANWILTFMHVPEDDAMDVRIKQEWMFETKQEANEYFMQKLPDLLEDLLSPEQVKEALESVKDMKAEDAWVHINCTYDLYRVLLIRQVWFL